MLTQRQRELLAYIDRYYRDNGVPPSYDEMRDGLKLQSKSGIHRLVSALEERGYIRRLAHRARAIELLKRPDATWPAVATAAATGLGENVVSGRFPPRPVNQGRDDGTSGTGAADNDICAVPLMGQIAAGSPIEAISQTTGETIPVALLGSGEHYALHVVGDSMVEAGILDGDVAVIKRGETADNGQIVVALVDDEIATLKRLRKRGHSIALEAANVKYEPQIYRADRVRVQGILAAILRRY